MFCQVWLILLLLVCTQIHAGQSTSSQSVWIDADPACDNKLTNDVDDCWALAYALTNTNWNIIGISTIFGNVDGKTSYKVGLNLLREFSKFGVNYPIENLHAGSNKPIEYSQSSNIAVEALHLALQKQTLTIIALGPVTNIALLLKHYPEDINRIQKVICVAGQRNKQKMTFKPQGDGLLHMHDLNFREDVLAFQSLIDSNIAITLLPFEVAKQVIITRFDLQVSDQTSDLFNWLSGKSDMWLTFWLNGFGLNGFYPFDLLAVAYAMDSKLFNCEYVNLEIIYRRSLFLTSRSNLVVSPSSSDTSKNTYCSKISTEAKNTLINHIYRIGKLSK